MPDFQLKCIHLIKDGNGYLCDATEYECIKDCIRFCPKDCVKFQTKKELKELEIHNKENNSYQEETQTKVCDFIFGKQEEEIIK